MAKATGSRVAPRCRRCPDFPLRTQCVHTITGRLYVRSHFLGTVFAPLPDFVSSYQVRV